MGIKWGFPVGKEGDGVIGRMIRIIEDRYHKISWGMGLQNMRNFGMPGMFHGSFMDRDI